MSLFPWQHVFSWQGRWGEYRWDYMRTLDLMKIIICNYNWENTSKRYQRILLKLFVECSKDLRFFSVPSSTCAMQTVQGMLGNVSGYMPGAMVLLCDQILISSLTQKNPLIFQINANNIKWWIIALYQNSITVKHWRIADWKLWIIWVRQGGGLSGKVRTKEGCHKAHCEYGYFITDIKAACNMTCII